MYLVIFIMPIEILIDLKLFTFTKKSIKVLDYEWTAQHRYVTSHQIAMAPCKQVATGPVCCVWCLRDFMTNVNELYKWLVDGSLLFSSKLVSHPFEYFLFYHLAQLSTHLVISTTFNNTCRVNIARQSEY